jgi:hypothetical protein
MSDHRKPDASDIFDLWPFSLIWMMFLAFIFIVSTAGAVAVVRMINAMP